MEPLLLFPDPPPPVLAQSLDLGGYPWKAAMTAEEAAHIEPEDGWSGAVICADEDPEGAFALCRSLRKRDEWAAYKTQVSQFELDRYLPTL